MIEVIDNSKDGIYNSNMELVDSFTDYSSKNLDFDNELMDDEENAKNPLGTTAHYNPDEMKITIYVTGRHIKDILRSISHELIHHVQNCRGDLSGMQDTSLGYAQRDKHMRDMEAEAFNSGNVMIFRDFEDNYKQRNFEDNYKQGNRKMSKLQENRLKRLNNLLMGQDKKVLEEQTKFKTREGTYKGVKYTGDSEVGGVSKVSLDRYTVRAIADCRRPKRVANYIKTQVDSRYVNDSELLLLVVGIESCAQKRKLSNVVSFLNMNKTEDLYDYITNDISMSSKFQERLFERLKGPNAGDFPMEPTAAPAAKKPSSGKESPSPERVSLVDTCPDGSIGDDQGRCMQDGKVVAIVGSQVTPNLAATRPKSSAKATPKGRIKYRKCHPMIKPYMRKGCGGHNVGLVQAVLYKMYQKHPLLKGIEGNDFIDEKYGTLTKKVVKQFQRDQKDENLKDDGIMGPLTFRALAKASGPSSAAAKKVAAAKPLAKATPRGPAPAPSGPPPARPIEMTRPQAIKEADKFFNKMLPSRVRSRTLANMASGAVKMLIDEKQMAPVEAFTKYEDEYNKYMNATLDPNSTVQSRTRAYRKLFADVGNLTGLTYSEMASKFNF
jgi:hypothetical protein